MGWRGGEGDGRKGVVGGGRMGEGAREGGAWVACAGGRFAGCFSGRPFTQEYIASAFQSDMNEGKRVNERVVDCYSAKNAYVIFIVFGGKIVQCVFGPKCRILYICVVHAGMVSVSNKEIFFV